METPRPAPVPTPTSPDPVTRLRESVAQNQDQSQKGGSGALAKFTAITVAGMGLVGGDSILNDGKGYKGVADGISYMASNFLKPAGQDAQGPLFRMPEHQTFKEAMGMMAEKIKMMEQKILDDQIQIRTLEANLEDLRKNGSIAKQFEVFKQDRETLRARIVQLEEELARLKGVNPSANPSVR
ncbi:MAG: hypothetical protein WCI76_00840 [bacterium]